MDDRTDRALEANGVAPIMTSEHRRQTAFLRHCLLYDDSTGRHELEKRITQLQHDEFCVRRAVWLMALFAALAMAGLGYYAIFVAKYPLNLPDIAVQWIIKLLCALGVGSIICLLAFLGLGVIYRKDLDLRREECRQLAMKIMESRLGKSCTVPLPGAVKDREKAVNGSGATVPASG